MTLLAERQYATIANAIVSVGFTPAGRQLKATKIAKTNPPLKSEGRPICGRSARNVQLLTHVGVMSAEAGRRYQTHFC